MEREWRIEWSRRRCLREKGGIMGVMERSGRMRQSRCKSGKWLTLRQVASLHRIPVGGKKKEQNDYSRFIYWADLSGMADTAGCGAPLIWCLTSSLSQQINILFNNLHTYKWDRRCDERKVVRKMKEVNIKDIKEMVPSIITHEYWKYSLLLHVCVILKMVDPSIRGDTKLNFTFTCKLQAFCVESLQYSL